MHAQCIAHFGKRGHDKGDEGGGRPASPHTTSCHKYPLMLTSPPEALSTFRFRPERKMPAGVSMVGAVGAVGAVVGASVQTPHSSGHCWWSESE